MNMVLRITGKAVRVHISSRMARELIAIYLTMYHLWFLESQRVLPQLRLHLPRHHLHHRSQHRPTVIQYWKTKMLRLQYPKIKIGNPKKYKEMYRMNCLIGYRNSGRIGLMKLLPKSVGETRCREVHILEPRAQVVRIFRRIRIVKRA